MTTTSESLSLQGGDGGDSLIIETRADPREARD
jgi:hypothetical protein